MIHCESIDRVYHLCNLLRYCSLIPTLQMTHISCIILTRVGPGRFHKRTAQAAKWQCKVSWQGKVHSFHFCFAQYTFCSYLLVLFLPCASVGVMDQLSSMSHKKPHPNLNENLNLMWSLLIVHELCWNFNILFISIVSNSFGDLFDINKSLLNCCVVKKIAFLLSTNCSAIECGEYLRDLALFELVLLDKMHIL